VVKSAKRSLFRKFIAKKAIEIKTARDHAYAFRQWEERYNHRRHIEQTNKLHSRRRQIEKKLVELGYGKALNDFKRDFPGRFERHYSVTHGGNFTEKEWYLIKGTFIVLLRGEEEKRLQRENDESLARLVTRPEFEDKRVSRSMSKRFNN